jgi:hypothetical protein
LLFPGLVALDDPVKTRLSPYLSEIIMKDNYVLKRP